MRFTTLGFIALAAIAIAAIPIHADMIFSTHSTARIDDLAIQGGDVVSYNLLTGVAQTVFQESEFGANHEQIDAIHVMATGDLILSTAGKAELGGLSFGSGDLVIWNSSTGAATLLFSQDRFDKKANIDAVFVRENGNIVMSTTTKSILDGVEFGDGDLIEYDPITDTATLLFDGSKWNGDIDGVHILDNGDLLLSINSPSELYGVRYDSGDIIRVNEAQNQASVYIDDNAVYGGSTFNWENVDALSMTTPAVPEPATLSLLALGGLILLRRHTRRD